MRTPAQQIDVDDCLAADGARQICLKIVQDHLEVNIYMSRDDALRIPAVRNACWNTRGSISIGRCAKASAFWSSTPDELSILVGHDDETWDIGIQLPLSLLDEIEKQVKAFLKRTS